MRTLFLQTTFVILAINVVSFFYLPEVLWSMVIFGPLILLGLRDITQKSHSILRNFPVLGHMRFLLEEIRPEMYQYFVESDTSGRPFSREQRSVVYARAKTRVIRFLLVQSKMFMKPATNGSTTHSVQKKWSMRTCES